jgi:TPR repeat protein
VILAALVWLIAPGAKDARIFGNPSHGPSDARGNTAKNLSAQAPETNDFDKLRKLATDGDPNAQFDMGARYATGEDVKQDYAESVRWFTLAAEQGHVIAQATLGAYYWAGRGIPQDLGKAYFWSLLAQAGGDEASKYRVSVLASRMPHSQVAAVQLQANDWLKAHQLSNGTSE